MIPIKIQCGCGQRYAFEVEPVNGQMGTAVACPVCGTDGTAAANEAISQALTAQPQAAPSSSLRVAAAVPAAPPGRFPVTPLTPGRLPALRAPAPAKLSWYEQIWIALPLALVAVGGAIGGGFGGLAWGVNKIVFKKVGNPVLRYLLTTLISASAVVLWLVIGSFVVSLIRRR